MLKFSRFLKFPDIWKSKNKKEVNVGEINTLTKEELKKTINKAEHKEFVVVCIGSDISIVDSLGPLVGTLLMDKQVPFAVYGTLENPIHALNLKDSLNDLQTIYKNKDPLILAIDACIGEKEQIGAILLDHGPLHPGSALNRSLPIVGDFHLKAVVSYNNHYDPTHFFKNTRLFTVMSAAKEIVDMVLEATHSNEALIQKPIK